MSCRPTLTLFRRIARGMVVAAICLSIGLQWAALQGIAWTSMLINFSKEGSLIEAMEKTFDGEHPCPLCKVVEEGEKQDQKTTLKSTVKKMEAVVAQVTSLIIPPGVRMTYPAFQEEAVRRLAPPLGKPPREALA